ncbi:MAG: GIY-YIG nuclease family protein [bacterium]
MFKEKCCAVYIMANKHSTTLYTGVTSNLLKRIWEHKNKAVKGFTHQYNINKLVYYELFGDITLAIEREKQIKNLVRRKKDDLINKENPEWRDLSDDL